MAVEGERSGPGNDCGQVAFTHCIATHWRSSYIARLRGGYPQVRCYNGDAFMETPCVNVCVIEADTGLCAGCGRSIDEISRWSKMTDTERRSIMLSLPGRRRDMRFAAER